ncbi:MAG: extracellular solute-binding protein [Clostridia bacterium]|nr:extracellular solute-binding protein [Clostridia bacterium]
MDKKRYVSAALAFIMLAAPLSSCGESASDPDPAAPQESGAAADVKETEVTTAAEETDGIETTDMNGWELSILSYNGNWLTWANTVVDVEGESGDVLDDSIYRRNAELQERFNFRLKVDNVDQVQAEIGKIVSAGDNAYQIYEMNEGNLLAYLPYISGWEDITGLRLSESWWNPEATSVYNISGHQTALAGDVTLSPVSRSVCMVVNKNIWSAYGDPSTDLYQLVRDNKWTVDSYMAAARSVKSDLNGDGQMTADDLYGLNMGRGFKGYIASFLAGSEMNFTSKIDGADVFTLGENEKALGLVTKLVDALGESGYYYNEDASVHGFAPSDFFKNGHALFTQGVPHDIYKLRDMNDDIGILPMPKYDESQDSFYSAAWGGAVWTLSKTLDKADDNAVRCMGTVLDAMAWHTEKEIIPIYKEIALKTKTARDDESADMLDIIFGSIYFDFGTNIVYDAVIADTVLAAIWKKKSSDSIVSSIDKNLTKINKYIADINEQAAQL